MPLTKPPTRRSARPRPIIAADELMLCTLVSQPFDDPQWLFEPKLDGLRVLCRCDRKSAKLLSRNDKPQDFQFPDIVDGLRAAVIKPCTIDGEIVCLDHRGISSFRALQQRFHLENEAIVGERAAKYPAYLYVFDIMELAGDDVRGLPLRDRKEKLRGAITWSNTIRFTEGIPAKGVALLNKTCKQAGEGIVGKRLTSKYIAGRSGDWVKIKCSLRQEFVIGGYTDPQRSRVGFGALLVGYYSDDGKRLHYAGKVGTGFNNEMLMDLRRRLEKICQKDSPFDQGPVDSRPPRGSFVHWVRPQLVAELAFGEWTQNGMLRQPRFEGFRTDKKPKQVRRERPK
jgi:bifunctional non-homologous end joining protein LigD